MNLAESHPPYRRFDRTRVRLQSLHRRKHDVSLNDFPNLDSPEPEFKSRELAGLCRAIIRAKQRRAIVVLAVGAHVIRSGAACYITDLMKKGFIDHICFNGACAIHDYELALAGATTESVSRYIRDGRFGMWKETGSINDIVKSGIRQGYGFGQALGTAISRKKLPYRESSITFQAHKLGIPLTVHIGIGYDIIHGHPNFDAAAAGAASDADFLVFAKTVERLNNGVYLCAGSAVMGPEVFLKALSMVRNVYPKKAQTFTTAVFDIVPIAPGELRGTPSKRDYRYFFRPWKTILIRTLGHHGKSFYIQGRHEETFPAMHRFLVKAG